ncbi:MAG TPA: hypothetical protein VFP72_00560 [Kineosporiaceae bacterium]|nr:hypothetical protein [Kineosporiaceae bacterium]
MSEPWTREVTVDYAIEVPAKAYSVSEMRVPVTACIAVTGGVNPPHINAYETRFLILEAVAVGDWTAVDYGYRYGNRLVLASGTRIDHYTEQPPSQWNTRHPNTLQYTLTPVQFGSQRVEQVKASGLRLGICVSSDAPDYASKVQWWVSEIGSVEVDWWVQDDVVPPLHQVRRPGGMDSHAALARGRATRQSSGLARGML